MTPPSTHQKILFKYHSPILDEKVCETMWATPIDAAKGIYKLANIPSYGPLIATDDEFYAVFDELEQWLTYQKTTKTSGNSVVVVMVIHESYDKEVIRYGFRKLNCASEGVSANYFAMEILKDTDYESTPKTRFVMRMSEKFKIEIKEKIFRRRSQSYVEERFFLLAKILNFAAIRNRKGYSEWTQS